MMCVLSAEKAAQILIRFEVTGSHTSASSRSHRPSMNMTSQYVKAMADERFNAAEYMSELSPQTLPLPRQRPSWNATPRWSM